MNRNDTADTAERDLKKLEIQAETYSSSTLKI